MNNSKQAQQQHQQKIKRIPLAKVVSDCTRRWFQDTLQEAKAGDSAMQLLVGQMYKGGYGTPQNAQEGHTWIHKASSTKSSTSTVCGEHPGNNGSESDSDDTRADVKVDS